MEWRYSPFNPACRHAFDRDGTSIHGGTAAICGQLAPWFSDWRGTGNQQEYEKLASLRPCKNCVKRGAPEGSLAHDKSSN